MVSTRSGRTPGLDPDALPAKRLGQCRDQLRLFAAQQRAPCQQRHLDPEPGENLGELDGDDAAADDGQPARQVRQVDRLDVGDEPGLPQPRHLRHHRPRPDGDDDLLGPEEPPRPLQSRGGSGTGRGP
jgi:hypothetical protein